MGISACPGGLGHLFTATTVIITNFLKSVRKKCPRVPGGQIAIWKMGASSIMGLPVRYDFFSGPLMLIMLFFHFNSVGQSIKEFWKPYPSLICEPLIDRSSTRSIINYILGNLKRIWKNYSWWWPRDRSFIDIQFSYQDLWFSPEKWSQQRGTNAQILFSLLRGKYLLFW